MSVVPEVLAYVAAGAASISAIASAVSARTNLAAVRRANLPLVYGEPGLGLPFDDSFAKADEKTGASVTAVDLRLVNDGPGTAVEVRCCLRSTSGDWRSDVTTAVRAMHPRERVPMGFQFRTPWEVDPNITSWGVATRFLDTSGREWETFNQRFPPGKLRIQRLQSRHGGLVGRIGASLARAG